MKTINVKELNNISIKELTKIIEQGNGLLFELFEWDYVLKLDNLPYGYGYYMEIYPMYDETFFKDLKMVNDENEKDKYFEKRFDDIIVRYGTFPETETIENLAIIVKHLVDIYHKNFLTKKELNNMNNIKNLLSGLNCDELTEIKEYINKKELKQTIKLFV